MFNTALDVVALIRKTHPVWQAGKLNGIGGHIDMGGENPVSAMVREFFEETGVVTTFRQWSPYCLMRGSAFEVRCFAAIGDVFAVRSTTAETVSPFLVAEVAIQRLDAIENLPWLIHLAIDSLRDGRPSTTTVNYP